ncbi:MAG: SdrD B-like domain-containing protein [Thiothrix sp.]|uniref:SdrD B-like domain-containing protein n=1 Tax=Thiothrix sp. TaxID=1032 RepID=UPI00262FE64E|nr:SdrD B-like domain-containing protein [Thiothrix sp.]MDD5392159.1 SdrD B-like domain-containing protein [Thiothrix sp.]
MHKQRASSLVAGLGAGVLLLIAAPSYATGTQTFTKELLTGATAKPGETVTYRFKLACSSLTSDCGNLTVNDTLPDGLEALNCSVPSGFTAVSCDSSNPTIKITKNDLFNGGDSFTIDVATRVKLGTAAGTVLANTATSVITSPDAPDNGSLPSTASNVTVDSVSPHWSLVKERISPNTSLLPAPGTDVSYQVKFCADGAVGNVSLAGVKLTDAFPAGATVVNNGGATAGGSDLVWDLGNQDLATLYAGRDYNSQYCTVKIYTLRYPLGTFPIGTDIVNTLSATGTPEGSSEGPVGSPVTINEKIGEPTPGANLGKWSADTLSGAGGSLNWGVVANVDSSNAPVPDLIVYDALPTAPAGLVPKRVLLGYWPSPATTHAPDGSDVRATLSYATDSSDCKTATYTDLVVDAKSADTSYDLDPATKCLRWKFKDMGPDGPAVPRGWAYNPYWAQNVFVDTSGVAGPFPVQANNCMSATFTKFDGSTGEAGSSCHAPNIEDATPAIGITKAVVNGSAFAPDADVQFKLTLENPWGDSTGEVVNPVLADLLPKELEFASWDNFSVNDAAPAFPQPNLETIPDYNGTGRTLVRFTWSATPAAGAVRMDGSAGVANAGSLPINGRAEITLTAKVKAGTIPGSYTNQATVIDNSPRATCLWNSKTDVDANDVDGDANKTEQVCYGETSVPVVSAAVIAAEKWVKGEYPTLPNVDDPLTSPSVTSDKCPLNGDGYTRFPCVAQVKHGGAFDYKLVVSNKGNEALINYILYDVLPALGDTGVGQPVSGLQRGSKWHPVMTGAITAADADTKAASAVFEYSTAANPCRPEVSSSATETPADHWQSGCTDDWTAAPADFSKVTAFRIKAAFASAPYWEPLKTLTFNVPMQAPEDAPPSIVGNTRYFSPAWNSLAHRVTQQSNAQRLDTAEPRQVGIIVPTLKYRLGNLVWKDDNGNGIADAGEAGIANVDVELYDSTNAKVATTKTDANGNYLFEGLVAGKYRVVIPTPTTQAALVGLKSSGTGEEASPDANVDNNDNGVSIDPALGLVSGEVTVDATPAEPENEVLRTDGSDDDNDAWPDIASNKTVDFGFVTAPAAPKVDVSVIKTVDKTDVHHGDTVVYTLTVTNAGPDAATDAVVSDKLPTGVTYVSDDASSNGMTYDSATGVWTVGALAVSENKILKITAKVD